MPTDDLDHAIRCGPGREEAQIFAESAHQIDEAGVIDQIHGAVGRRVSGVVRLVGVRCGVDLSRRSSEAEDAWM